MSVRLITKLIVNGKFLPVMGSLFFNKIAPALLIPAYIFFVPMSAHQKMQDGLKGLFELAQSSAQSANNYFTNIAPDMKQEFSQLATNNSETIINNFSRQKLEDETPNFLGDTFNFIGSFFSTSDHGITKQQHQQFVKNEATMKLPIAPAKFRDLSWAVGVDVHVADDRIVNLNQFGGCTVKSEISRRTPAAYASCPADVLQMLVAKGRS